MCYVDLCLRHLRSPALPQPGAHARRGHLAAESDGESIQVGGMERFCNDLQVDPSDPIMLLIAWRLGAATMCVFTREEWTRGFTEMGCDSIEKLRDSFDSLREIGRAHV